ncbi:hypothetical protein Tco_0681170 [Tanacetum coccineum]|uniref:Uncharacterized protein n=1 Tax=Tanacetum coccineum TaxID=301880 RepID=A0ABQ4XNI3_9ASTR
MHLIELTEFVTKTPLSSALFQKSSPRHGGKAVEYICVYLWWPSILTTNVPLPPYGSLLSTTIANQRGAKKANPPPNVNFDMMDLQFSTSSLIHFLGGGNGPIRFFRVDFYGEELTLRLDDEAITFKVGQTSRYSYNDVVSINRIDVIDIACEEYAQEVLGFSDSSTAGNPTSYRL